MTHTFRLSFVLIILMTLFYSGLATECHAGNNLASLAIAKGSGKAQMAAIDGIKQQDGKGEWIGGSPNAWYGWINYPKIELHRPSTGKPLIFPGDNSVIAVATDDSIVSGKLPMLNINVADEVMGFSKRWLESQSQRG